MGSISGKNGTQASDGGKAVACSVDEEGQAYKGHGHGYTCAIVDKQYASLLGSAAQEAVA